eukprot:CAMPEP_0206200010 /NCGR_PEP_ID=MMETSP0166-20121206/10613_1 /ASSEMBLY_ACC=CAM_ASM_000260 /TAXON_ID=95228 /ORGANISM="Vannella robusta, Strain DIVA3 518/3/11/1/6" /LENGTH=307 /DNA_ID=CAMNT_0053618243 /DNA_START=245 /DNA_END=1168 /DNA_ORIENTATION=-
MEDNYYLILRTSDNVETGTIPTKDVSKKRGLLKTFLKKSKKKPEQYAIIKYKPELGHTALYECNYQAVKDQLLQIESPDVFEGKFRIGLLYSQPHQNNENEMFCNTEVSQDFEEFTDLLGTRIELQGWNKYPGGLDVVGGKTGKYSLFTEFEGNEIMWHVPTMMPFFPDDPQQLERKKHVGNDRAVVIFRDPGGDPIPPNIVHSKAVHLCIVIEPVHNEEGDFYRVCVAYKNTVPFFEPALPEEAEFKKGPTFINFLLHKLINGIQATSHAEEFKQLMSFKYKHSLTCLCSDYGVKQEKKEQPEDVT